MTDKEEKLLAEYRSIKSSLEEWGKYVDNTLEKSILNDSRVVDFVKLLSRHRLKDEKSFLYKAFYRKKVYQNPLLEIEDKIGTRVVLLKSDEIELVSKLILECKDWNAKISKHLRSEVEDQPKIFDYQSMHIIVSPNDTYEHDNKKVLTCEIQIRTLLQHAFAEVSHDSTYKGPYKNDAEIIRHLAKSMALMEATDDYFARIFSLMADEKREYTVYIKELAKIFKQFCPGFENSHLNFDVTERIFELLALKNVSLVDLEAFVEKRKKDFERAIKPQNGLLFQQPISILIGYYIIMHQEFLRNNWPLNKESLMQVYKGFNISFARY